MNKVKPRYLYKYCQINKHTLNMIKFNKAYFPLPLEFNDPFDCNVLPKIEYAPEEKEKFIKALMENGQCSQNEIYDLINNFDEIMDKGIKCPIDGIRNNMRIFCLSEVNDNVMMYSHYADSHRGICLEFAVSEDIFFDHLNYIRYEDVPIFNPCVEDANVFLPIIQILLKSSYWSYEKEWRIIKQGPSPCEYEFTPGTISAIIFGYKTSSEDRLLIKSIINNREPVIQLKKVYRSAKNSFNLEIKPFEP